MHRLLAVDIDGTLTGTDRRLDFEAADVLRELNDSGVCVVLATGNVVCFARSAQILVGSSEPVIAENGGVVEMERDGEPEALFPPEEPRRAVKSLDGAEEFPEGRMTEVALRPESVDEDEVRGLADDFDVEVVYTGFAYHVKNPEADKGAALRRIAEELGYGREEILAIGDSENDVGMIREAHLGGAVGNAHGVLKEAADIVVEEEFGDGLRAVVREMAARGELPGTEPA